MAVAAQGCHGRSGANLTGDSVKKTLVAAACAMLVGAVAPAYAQSNAEMKQQIELLQRQLEALKARMDQMAAQPAPAAAAAPTNGGSFIERKAGDGVTLLTRGGEIRLYGNLDLSADYATKGLDGLLRGDGNPPAGNGGWMSDIASNLSYVGVRGYQTLGNYGPRFVYQLETQVDVSVTSGTTLTNSNQSNSVKGGLTSRNSFIGLAGNFGAVKIGKTDAPYKASTSSMNPFSAMLGDYQVIMGNSGGDNRVEFGTRLDHSIWYESPHWGPFSFNALFSPGQNRANDNSNIASGEGDCAGGNVPGSGGGPVACNDGAFGNVFSASGIYNARGLKIIGAYEIHKKVNRTSDMPAFDPNDVADETAAKVGASYRFAPTGTTVSAIYERLRRNLPASLAYQNERSRNGTWLAVSQAIGPKDSLHFGWAHAGRTPGDPDAAPGDASPDNEANMFTLAWKHQVDKNFSYYVDYATTRNHPDAHFDLGAGGHGVTTDCHDASNPDTSGFDPNGGAPHCVKGGKLQGVSVGMKYTF
jgi:predicted porin